MSAADARAREDALYRAYLDGYCHEATQTVRGAGTDAHAALALAAHDRRTNEMPRGRDDALHIIRGLCLSREAP